MALIAGANLSEADSVPWTAWILATPPHRAVTGTEPEDGSDLPFKVPGRAQRPRPDPSPNPWARRRPVSDDSGEVRPPPDDRAGREGPGRRRTGPDTDAGLFDQDVAGDPDAGAARRRWAYPGDQGSGPGGRGRPGAPDPSPSPPLGPPPPRPSSRHQPFRGRSDPSPSEALWNYDDPARRTGTSRPATDPAAMAPSATAPSAPAAPSLAPAPLAPDAQAPIAPASLAPDARPPLAPAPLAPDAQAPGGQVGAPPSPGEPGPPGAFEAGDTPAPLIAEAQGQDATTSIKWPPGGAGSEESSRTDEPRRPNTAERSDPIPTGRVGRRGRRGPLPAALLGQLTGRKMDRRAVAVNDHRIGKLEPEWGLLRRLRSLIVLVLLTVLVAAVIAAVLALAVEALSVALNHAVSKSAGP
ncbi:MAG: hypothetical protein NVS3B21_05680 [Acidimicrobiales bacterium]